MMLFLFFLVLFNVFLSVVGEKGTDFSSAQFNYKNTYFFGEIVYILLFNF